MFAKAYDLLMADVDYEALYTWLKPYLNTKQTIMDAGCGSGYLLLELLKAGHQAIGIDHDTSMLSIAQDKIISNGYNPLLYEHDLRDSMGVKVDVVLAMFDVVNYFKGVKTVFRHIHQALNQGGLLIFDIYQTQVLKDYDHFIESEIHPIAYTWSIKTQGHQLIHEVEISNQKETVLQYVYDVSYYRDILIELGFKIEIRSGIDPRKHYIIAYKL